MITEINGEEILTHKGDHGIYLIAIDIRKGISEIKADLPLGLPLNRPICVFPKKKAQRSTGIKTCAVITSSKKFQEPSITLNQKMDKVNR